MQTNQAGIDLIKAFEGLRLTAYQDQAGVWTIGYGSTSGVFEGQTITEPQAEAMLVDDLKNAEKAVETALRVEASPNQFAALVSFTFNEGAGALRGSTLLRLFNQGNVHGAADEFLKWKYIHENGQLVESPGLLRRREAERDLFLLPVSIPQS